MYPSTLHFNGVVFTAFMMAMLVGGTVLVVAAIIVTYLLFALCDARSRRDGEDLLDEPNNDGSLQSPVAV